MSRMGFSPSSNCGRMKVLTSPWKTGGNVHAIARTDRTAGCPHRFRRVTEGPRDARGSEPSTRVGKRYIPEPNYVPLRAAAGVSKAVQAAAGRSKEAGMLGPVDSAGPWHGGCD